MESLVSLDSGIAIGHTHGPPVERNAHPHVGENNNLAVIQNGIVENFNCWLGVLMVLGDKVIGVYWLVDR